MGCTQSTIAPDGDQVIESSSTQAPEENSNALKRPTELAIDNVHGRDEKDENGRNRVTTGAGLVYYEATDNSKNLFAAIKKLDLDTVQNIAKGILAEVSKDTGNPSIGVNHMRGMWNSTPLIVAIQYGSLDIADFLLSLQDTGDLNHRNDKGASALLYACMEEGFTDIVKKLLQIHKVEVSIEPTKEPVYNSAVDRTMRCTPLSAAITNGRDEVVKLLLAAGCNINQRFSFATTKSIRRTDPKKCDSAQTSSSSTAIAKSPASGKKQSVRERVGGEGIEESNSVKSGIFFPSMKGMSSSQDEFDGTLLSGAGTGTGTGAWGPGDEAAAGGALNLTPILLACASGQLGAAQELLWCKKAECQCFCFDSEASSVLHHLARCKGEDAADIFKLLVKHNKINTLLLSGTDCNGETPLHVACDSKNAPIVQCLLEEGANPGVRVEATGQTALHLGLKKRSLEVCTALLQYGADPLIRDDKGVTPYDTALKIHKDSQLRQAVEGAGLAWMRLRGLQQPAFDATDLSAIPEVHLLLLF